MTHRLLVLLAEFDRREGWSSGWGFRSCAHWLSWRTGIDTGAAREKVRVARALTRLPLLSDALRRGEISYAKVRAVTRVCTPENGAELLELARCGTASHVERLVRAWRRTDRLTELKGEETRHEGRGFSIHVDHDGMYVVRGRLMPEVGAVLERALAAAATSLRGRPEGSMATAVSHGTLTHAQKQADAIGLVAECALAGEPIARDDDRVAGAVNAEASRDAAPGSGAEPDADTAPDTAAAAQENSHGPRRRRRWTRGRAERYQVMVHVDATALREESETGQSVMGGGIRISAETARRMSCDATLVFMTHDAGGGVLDVGRRTRAVPSAIRRALDHRDRCCRFPGCDARYCDAHHVRHWADGGATKLDNLVLLCRLHHRAVHEQGFRIEQLSDGVLEFYTPNGRLVPQMPAAPSLPENIVEQVVAGHAANGLSIDAHTGESAWLGEALDVNMALWMLRRPPAA